jgi:hypothetical protein
MVNQDELMAYNKANFGDPVIPKVSGFNDPQAFFTLKPKGARKLVRWASPISDLKTINPILVSESSQIRILYLAYDTLVKYGPDTKPAPWAASEVKAVDPTTVEVTLRNDLKFHDGQKLTARNCLRTQVLRNSEIQSRIPRLSEGGIKWPSTQSTHGSRGARAPSARIAGSLSRPSAASDTASPRRRTTSELAAPRQSRATSQTAFSPRTGAGCKDCPGAPRFTRDSPGPGPRIAERPDCEPLASPASGTPFGVLTQARAESEASTTPSPLTPRMRSISSPAAPLGAAPRR